ncbi:hypothetical protein HKBW3S43_01047 [Candidatus Hakubella thermalkaliphila]|uniref:Uncharacterized protein n=1 Tax=Candidatus Hakubella thermalkaliphila TaxID=2754717 RepID=A0A6V8NX03_9ACTN|nr:hypothetical protein [Candidatus Hakubella thermalkaliphila]MBT9167205.1 hypothetical protein [Bacillota bacterium]MBT9174065.1 hypothetical protein [Bacillota bacterium]GFP24785.1 hypothetical protein HKBW3S25_00222 [Candidatus Hakubella thermalkaliphila]GFP26947.1 hypothetical protein HKBW3S33_00360 [Candidatus Hakubella thermalkaliphila]GFP35255.1 hypothetical protein HKBW3S43_01047 [Candidatus Hakubella thermalkaliphila]
MLRTIVIILLVVLVFNTLFWVAMVLYHVRQGALITDLVPPPTDYEEWKRRITEEAGLPYHPPLPFPLRGNVVQDLAWLVSIDSLAIAGVYFLLSDRLKKLRQIIGVEDTELRISRGS